MLEYVFRFNVVKGKQNEFIDWLRANEDDLRTHTRPGWTYIGTLMTVGGFGDYDGESPGPSRATHRSARVGVMTWHSDCWPSSLR